jgi:MFS superfamily sulfate permease-like transporter
VIPGVMILRPESGLVYFNIDHVRDMILNAVHAQHPRPAVVIVDLSAAAQVDIQSVEALGGLADELKSEGIDLHAVEARSNVRDRIRAAGVDAKLGGINRFSTVADLLDNLSRTSATHNAEESPEIASSRASS